MLIGRAGGEDLRKAADAYYKSLSDFRDPEIAWRDAIARDGATQDIVNRRGEAEKKAISTLEALQYFVSRKLLPPD